MRRFLERVYHFDSMALYPVVLRPEARALMLSMRSGNMASLVAVSPAATLARQVLSRVICWEWSTPRGSYRMAGV